MITPQMGQISMRQWLAEERGLCLCSTSVHFARSFQTLPPFPPSLDRDDTSARVVMPEIRNLSCDDQNEY